MADPDIELMLDDDTLGDIFDVFEIDNAQYELQMANQPLAIHQGREGDISSANSFRSSSQFGGLSSNHSSRGAQGKSLLHDLRLAY